MAQTTTSSFTTWKVNRTTFAVREDDAFGEHPLIYVKVHQKAPILVLSDTGTDEASEEHRDDRYSTLRNYLENCPIEANDNAPLNPGGWRQYYIVFTHCHYDHTGGILQFLAGGTTEIIASAAGKEFIQSDFEGHALYKYIDKPAPYFHYTWWAESFERLKWPLWHDKEGPKPYQNDLALSIIHTPGHTPDELAWYDHYEMHLSCGDSFYEEGEDEMPILFPNEGNLIEWVFSMQKLLIFVRSENARAAQEAAERADEEGWVSVPKRVTVSCAHQTFKTDGESILATLEKFAARVFQGKVPVAKKELWHEEAYYWWRDGEGEGDEKYRMSIKAPARLMDEARRFFSLYVRQQSAETSLFGSIIEGA